MRFQILHESRGRVRLRAMQHAMSMRDADLLEAWILALPGVDQVTVHERICGVTILFTGDRDTLYSALARFSYEEAGEEVHVLSPHSREINREYKEKLVFQVLRHYGKKLFLPTPLRQIINTVSASKPRRARIQASSKSACAMLMERFTARRRTRPRLSCRI